MARTDEVTDRAYAVRIRLLDRIAEKVERDPDPESLKLLAEALSKVMYG
jgi:hypothetical protein